MPASPTRVAAQVELTPYERGMAGHPGCCCANPSREQPMKVRPSVKPMCEKCQVIRRHGRVMVLCTNPRHKQRQG